MNYTDTYYYTSIFGYVYEIGFGVGLYKRLKEEFSKEGIIDGNGIFPLYDGIYTKINQNDLVEFFSRSYKDLVNKNLSFPIEVATSQRIDSIMFASIHAGYSYCENLLNEFSNVPRLEFLALSPYIILDDYNRPEVKKSRIARCEYFIEHILAPQFPASELDSIRKYLQEEISQKSSGIFVNTDMLIQMDNRVFVLDLSSYVRHLILSEPGKGTPLQNDKGLLDRDDLNGASEAVSYFDRTDFMQSTYLAASKLREKSIISRLNIDSDNVGFIDNKRLREYMSSIGMTDKETYKTIQAAAYGFNYVSTLERCGSSKFSVDMTISASGWSNVGYSSINALWSDPSQKRILEQCFEIYRHKTNDKKRTRKMVMKNICGSLDKILNETESSQNMDAFEIAQDIQKKTEDAIREAIETKRTVNLSGLPVLTREEKKHLRLGSKISEEDLAMYKPEIDRYLEIVNLSCKDELFSRSFRDAKDMTYRDLHAAHVVRALEDENIEEIYLMGCPGIGKTTAVVEYLKSMENPFCFVYASSRVQVNNDMRNKLKSNGKIFKDNIVAITTNSALIENCSQNNGQNSGVVEYETNNPKDLLDLVKAVNSSVEWLTEEECNVNAGNNRGGKSKTNAVSVGTHESTEKRGQSAGVLETLSRAIGSVFWGNMMKTHSPFSIAATVSLQSLQRIRRGTTMKNLQKMFDPFVVVNKEKTRAVLNSDVPDALKPTFIFMIDEITGADCGMHFRKELDNFLRRLELRKYFKIKLIVADASLVSKNALEACLKAGEKINAISESKIFVEPLQSNEKKTIEWIHDSKKRQAFININGFPASSLTLNFHGSFDILPLNKDERKKQYSIPRRRGADDSTKNRKIAELIKSYTGNFKENFQKNLIQTMFFEQGKEYINDFLSIGYEKIIGTKLREVDPTKESDMNAIEGDYIEGDYMVMTADLSEYAKKRALVVKNHVPLIAMTSVANRGVSFELLQRIICDIPLFSMENNLMEIVQLAYRMRGSFQQGTKTINYENEPKTMDFVYSDNVYVSIDDIAAMTPEEQTEEIELLAHRKTVHMLCMAILVYGALLTRIEGYVSVGENHYSIIPVGQSLVQRNFRNFCSILAEVKQTLSNEKDKAQHLRKNIIEMTGDLKSLVTDAFEVRPEKNSEMNFLIGTAPNLKMFSTMKASLSRNFLDFIENAPLFNVTAVIGNCFISKIKSVQNTINLSVADIKKHYDQNKKIIHDLIHDNNSSQRLKGSLLALEKMMRNASEKEQHHLLQSLVNDSETLYVIIPIPVLIEKDLYTRWNSEESEMRRTKDDEIGFTATDSLKSLVSSAFPSVDRNSLIPFIPSGDGIPYTIFSCSGLEENMRRIFSTRIKNSADLNVLSLIAATRQF